ncbi:transmembrane protein 225B [Carlito syrichta]|uniref:Transmembrane protein 225B n=1 Tax=Carlito syrichta TaxID=1868482 RepID=A0A3Q0DWH3_CARSF|nr:transmembrane protein 225B [Carlito syrichta]
MVGTGCRGRGEKHPHANDSLVFCATMKTLALPNTVLHRQKSPGLTSHLCHHFSLTQVTPTSEDKDMKGFIWAVAPVLTSLGYLLILLVSVFPFWVRLRDEESHEEFFSGLFENCFHIRCWKPRPLSSYILLGRAFLLFATILAFFTTLFMVSFAFELFPRTRKQYFMSAFTSCLTGACTFLALMLHALEIQDLRMKSNSLQFSVQWPYYVLGFDILLFIVVGAICLSQETACPGCRLLSISQKTEDGQESLHLDNLESLGELNSAQKKTLLTEEIVI